MRKVRIKRLPQAKAGGRANGYTNTVPEQIGNFGGADVGEYKVPDISTRRTLGPVNKEEATIEAEKGEVAYGDINGDNFTETYVIGGKRHGAGGTPLNLPPGTFIFSDFRDMMIKDPKILAMFGKADKKGKSKKGYTPATLAKMYDINKYREILDNKDSDKRDKDTAELMIEEYQDKLGALAIAQESLKDFEQGIPEVARPYMEKRGLNDEDILPEGHPALQQQQGAQQISQGQDMMQQEQMPPMARFGGGLNPMPNVRLNRAQFGGGLNPMPNVELNRFIPKYQSEGEVFPEEFKTDKETIDYLKAHPNLSDPTQWSQEEKDWWEKNNEYYLNQQKFERVISPTPNESMTPEERAKYDREFQRRMMHRMDWGKPTPGYLQPSMDAIDECPCMQKVPMPLADGTIIMEDRCIPCEQMNTAQNGGSLNRMPLVNLNRFIPQAQQGGPANFTPHTMYDGQGGQYPADTYERHMQMQEMGYTHEPYQRGGNLPRYQKKGEVTYKTYVEEDLPEGTIIKDYYSPFTTVGDYVRLGDGTIRKVKTKGVEQAQHTQTSQGTIEDYMKTDDGKANTERANAIIQKGIADGTIKELGNGNIRILGNFTPSFQDRIILSRTLNASGKKFGTDKYKVAKQSFTEGYSDAAKGKGSGNFVAGFTPEDYEKRFMFELMTGSGANDDAAFARIDEIYADPERKLKARKMYLSTLGINHKDISDDDLLSEDYYKNNYAEVTRGIEKHLGESGYRPVIGNEQLSGFEHFDALGIKQPLDYEGEDPVIEEEEEDLDPNRPDFPQKPKGPAPWWLQDEVNIAGNVIDRSRIKKYLPWAPGVDLEEADPTFVDPTGAVNAQNAAGNASLQALSQFTGPQAASARAMGIQGQMANQAAQTVNRYDTQNVGIANQFEMQNLGIRNQERMMDAQRSGKLFDQNTIANQQYDNAMLQLRREGRGMYNQAVTNRWKTDALNQMYPDYAVDPSVGGQMYHDPNYRDPNPKRSNTYRDAVNYWKSQGFTDQEAVKAAKNEVSVSGGPGGYTGSEMDIVNSQYGQNGGLVMGSNVFPFMFY